MKSWIMLSGIYRGEGFELIATIVIIIITVTGLVFLFRNILNELRDYREKRLVRRNDDVDEDDTSKSHLLVERRTANRNSNDIIGLVNQRIYESNEGTIAVLFLLNLDEFKFIVEKYDEKTIQKTINEIKKRLRKMADGQSVAGHLKKDVFVYYLTGDISNEVIEETSKALLETINEPIKAIDETITTSIGISIFPYDGITANHLIDKAEVALYVAKKDGKNKPALYSEDLIDKEQFDMDYYQQIKQSIENDEFLLYYQPIVDLRAGRIIGMESLLRWNHPTMGILSPGKFLNVMELTGDITWFGTWGFEQIVKVFKQWKKKFRLRDVFISTNLSPKQLMVEGLADKFYDIVRRHEMSPEHFCLEIIDYYALLPNSVAFENLAVFRKYGFRLAIDDLGDDYQIVDQMTDIPAGIVKISRQDMMKVYEQRNDSDDIIRAIHTAIADQKVLVAEGIEDEEMIAAMADLGIRFMQGYYFSKPKAINEIEKLFVANPWDMDSFKSYYQ